MSNQEAARVQQAQERTDHLKHNRERETIAEIFARAEVPRFKIPPEQVLQALGTITFDADGVPLNAGKPLEDRLRDYASINPQAVAATVAEIHDKGKSSVRSRADLKSVKDKVDFIAEHGEIAYSRLPVTAPDVLPGEPTTYADYINLPMSVRAKLLGQHGAEWLARLQHKAGEQQRFDRLVGVPAGSRR